MTDDNPLRGVVECGVCKRKFTSRNTSKYRVKNGEKIKKLHPYYGCANPDCSDRANIKKSYLEGQFEDLLQGFSINDSLDELVTSIFEEQRKKRKASIGLEKTNKADILNDIKLKQKKIEEALIRTSHPILSEKMEKEWSDLEAEKGKLNTSMESIIDEQELKKELVLKTQNLFKNPLEIRKSGNPTIRALLLKVRF